MDIIQSGNCLYHVSHVLFILASYTHTRDATDSKRNEESAEQGDLLSSRNLEMSQDKKWQSSADEVLQKRDAAHDDEWLLAIQPAYIIPAWRICHVEPSPVRGYRVAGKHRQEEPYCCRANLEYYHDRDNGVKGLGRGSHCYAAVE